jgi:hypothetical protein
MAHVDRAERAALVVAELGDVGRHLGRQQPRAQARLGLARQGQHHVPVRQRGHARHRCFSASPSSDRRGVQRVRPGGATTADLWRC